MSDYLANLAARAVEQAPALRPRLPSRFEPSPAVDETALAIDADRQAPAQQAAIPRPTEAMPPAHPGHPAPAMALPGSLQAPVRGLRPAQAEASARSVAQALTPPESDMRPLAAGTAMRAAAEPDADKRQAPAALEPVPQRSPLAPALLAPTPVLPPLPHAPAARPATPLTARAQMTPPAEPKAPAPAAPAPTIQVTIGRIEVRATPPAQPPQRQRRASAVMSLEEYLSQRSRGGGK